MFHVKHLMSLLLAGLCGVPTKGQGKIDLQDKPFVYQFRLDSTLWSQLGREEAFRSLSQREKEFCYWTNVFRQNPKGFYKEHITPFLGQYPEAHTAEARSLKADIDKATPAGVLLPEDGLNKMARVHASYLAGRGGEISHYGAGGKGFADRIREAGNYRCGAENIFAGSPDALEALILLLIDHGVANKGHRKNLMDPNFTHMGASFPTLDNKRALLVQTFGCK